MLTIAKFILKGLASLIIFVGGLCVIVAVVLSPAVYAYEGSNWWLLLYTPHVVGTLYFIGKEGSLV